MILSPPKFLIGFYVPLELKREMKSCCIDVCINGGIMAKYQQGFNHKYFYGCK
jgi:hypothetical protein